MCLIDLLNDNQTQNGFTAIFEILKLNFEKINHSLGILQYVLLQIVVARRNNEARSKIIRLPERDNVIGTAIDHLRCGLPRMTSVRQDIVVRQRH